MRDLVGDGSGSGDGMKKLNCKATGSTTSCVD